MSNAALDSIALRIFSAAYDPDTLTASRREEKTCSLKTVKITKQMRIDLENRGTDAAFRLRTIKIVERDILNKKLINAQVSIAQRTALKI